MNSPIPDPIIEAIRDYRLGMTAYNCGVVELVAEASDDALIRTTYGPPLEVLSGWTRPAQTREGAVEALRFARQELRDIEDSPVVERLVSAALAFLERDDV